MFPLTADTHSMIAQFNLEHLSVLEDEFEPCFPSISLDEYDWTNNPFPVTNEDTKHLPLEDVEEFAELQSFEAEIWEDNTILIMGFDKTKFSQSTFAQYLTYYIGLILSNMQSSAGLSVNCTDFSGTQR